MKKIVKSAAMVLAILAFFMIVSFQAAKHQLSDKSEAEVKSLVTETQTVTETEKKYMHPVIYFIGILVFGIAIVVVYRELNPNEFEKKGDDNEE